MKKFPLFIIAIFLMLVSCNKDQTKNSSENVNASQPSGQITSKEIIYTTDGKTFRSFIAFSGDSSTPKPVVLVFPEWWGVTDYAKSRAKQLADLGYFAMAVDFYGDGKTVETPADAQKLSEPFYTEPRLATAVFTAAKAELKKFPAADQTKVAAIGYCFGGAQALNIAREDASLKGVVSFHGNLMTGVRATNNKVKVLVCHGAADSFVKAEEISAFKKEMDSAKISYQFIEYPNAVHSFTNPNATAAGKKFQLPIAYNKEADEKSWADMKSFLAEIFK